jgi:hypothetical protein
MRKYTKWKPPKRDVLDLLGVNPLDMYKVGFLLFLIADG